MEALTCSLASLQAGEQLYGTAPLVNTWLLLEYNQPLSSKALVDNHLPEQVRAHLDKHQKSIPGSRLLLIQQSGRRRSSAVRFFIISSAKSHPVLLEYILHDIQEVLDLDITRLASQVDENQQTAPAQPLYLVCANGKRDTCCASHGAPFYRSLANLEPETTWQCSHVGGHRFAANAIYLPYGIYYGRLRTGQEREFLNSCAEKRILAAHYRGRSIYPAHVQAAEYFLHHQQPELRLDDTRLEQVLEKAPQTWQVQFRQSSSGKLFSILLEAGVSEYEVFENCGKEHELSRKMQYRWIA